MREPYQVTARYGDQVKLKSVEGAEYKRIIQHVKCFVTSAIESNGSRPSTPVVVPGEPAGDPETPYILEVWEGTSPTEDQSLIQVVITEDIRKRYPTPKRLGDYVTT